MGTRTIRPFLWFLLLTGLLVAVAIGWFALPARQWVEAFAASIDLFGAWGFPIVILAASIGAALAFLLSRHAVRARLRRLLEAKPSYAAIDRAVAEEGWKIVALLRLNPLVPFNLQNYFFGVTDIGFWPYAAATFFGIMPGAAFYVYLATLG